MSEQLTFLDEEAESLEKRIADLDKKLANLRSGLFKRYDESKRALEFLEGELEDLVKANLQMYGT